MSSLKMKGKSLTLEIDKCVDSRLWYTTWVTLSKEIDTLREDYTRDEILQLISLVQSKLRHTNFQNNYENLWIIWKILDLLGAGGISARPSDIEFSMQLNFVADEVPTEVQKELTELFVRVSESKNVGEQVAKLSNESIKFLEKCLQKSPALASCIIKSLLCVWSPFFQDSDLSLQNLHINSLRKYLNINELRMDELTAIISELKTTLPLSFDNRKLGNRSAGILLSILSKLELIEAKNFQLMFWLFPALFIKCNSNDIELAFYIRRSSEYLNEWRIFADKILKRSELADNLENSFAISNAIFRFTNNSDVHINSRELAYRTIKQRRHWLLDILDICDVLLTAGYPEKVSMLLSIPILSTLWPTVFFKVMSNIIGASKVHSNGNKRVSLNLCNSLRFVLDKCRPVYKRDESWNELHATTENQLNVVEWVLQNKESSNSEFDCEYKKNLTIKHVLSLLFNHGILFTLNSTTTLHDGNSAEIEQLLKNYPGSATTFKAYRSMLCALRAILLCKFYSKTQTIKGYLKEMKNTLNSLYPLEIRLEAMENIFSMIFLRHEDFCIADSNSEDSEEEMHEKKVPDSYYKRIQSGFICNKYIIRDLLHYLREVVIECSKVKPEPGSSDTELQKKLVNIDRALADASWRLELLTSSEFVCKVGHCRTDVSENRDEMNFSEVSLTKQLNTSKLLANRPIFYQQEDSSSSDEYTKSEVDLSSDPGSMDNTSSSTGLRKKQLKKIVVEKSMTFNLNNPYILNLMLSSRESLTTQYLWKLDFAKAQQVVEMFRINDSQLDGEVRFSKAICQYRRKIKENIKIMNPVQTVNQNTEISTLQNIRQAVQGGIETSRLMGQLETFLASNKAVLHLINPDEAETNELLTMAVLDLALTTGHSRSCSLNVFEIASKYLKSCKVIEKTMYSAYFSKICRLFYESKLDTSVSNILCNVNVPLSINKFNEKVEFWSEIDTAIGILNASRLDGEKSRKSLGPDGLSQEQLALIAALCNGEAYLNKIFTHLSVLETIFPNTHDGNFDRTQHGMLEQSIHLYFGHKFFELGVEPSELDDVAKKLGVNLVHSILVSCCPKLDFHDKVDKKNKVENERCYIVLNDNLTNTIATDYDMKQPNNCVAGILALLLDGIRNVYPTKSSLSYYDLENLSKNTNIQDILRTTSCLQNLHLCELYVGNETLTFFLNLWNLLFLHSLLAIWSIDAPCNIVHHIVSAMTIGYKIRDLGLVTLATLRCKLLGNLAWDMEFFKHIEDINEIVWQDLDLAQDPRVIFAMANEFFGTPAICVYNSNNLDDALNAAIRNYIDHYHCIDSVTDGTKIDVCWLPEPVRRYQDFLLENASLRCRNFNTHLDESFTLRKFLNVGENNLEFKYRPKLHQYKIRLNYSGDSCSAAQRIEAARCWSNNLAVSKKQSRTIDDSLLQYFEGHCWLLPYLVQKIHEKSITVAAKAYDNTGRCVCLENLLRSSWTEILRNTFEENQALVGMHENVSPKELWMYFQNLIKKEKWKQCLNIINCLPDNLTVTDSKTMDCLKDKVLDAILSSQKLEINEILKYLRQMKNIHVLTSTILLNLKRWPVEACECALIYVLKHSEKTELPSHCKMQLNATLSRVSAFQKMTPHFANNTDTQHLSWYAIAYPANKLDSLRIVKSMIDANKFEPCLEWLRYHTISVDMQSLVTQDLLLGLLENNRQDFKPPAKLLQALPIKYSVKLCNSVLNNLESIPAIKFITNYLLDTCKPGEAVKYYKILISVEILSQFERNEKPELYIHLLKEPLLMLEQLLMNGKFEILQKILKSVSENLPRARISIEDIDKVVRYYAAKSLEFRVSLQRNGIESKSKDSSSLNTEVENTEFLMPLKVPTKDEWVPNDKSRVCSCCKAIVFSMFNRRHHCRRCGRVVCGICSQQRMRVSTYPDSVLVRVCDDCKRQSAVRMHQQQGAISTPNSEAFDYWRLTTDETHNQTVRDEFSFEHTPSISLCLAILNLHSDHKAYASFLLDRCDEIRQLLRPVGSGRANPEVDHELLVKMMRSLLIAAKVKCAKISLNAGLDHCDRFLSHIDLVATLVQSDCGALIPSDTLDEHTLPRLRHLLTEKEQWILALDVSTKSGLDRQGVWAAWGKAYLRVGCYEQAREKFAHCLDKVSMNSFEDWVLLPNNCTPNERHEASRNTEKNEKQKAREKTRPTRNPPLLMEILQILESSTFNRHPCRSTNLKYSIARDISVTLNNIKSISRGRYYDPESASNTDNAYYHESLHYLLSYGSHSAILEFFVKHEKYEECLIHVLENSLDPEMFFQSVYLLCLRSGCVEKLHNAMRAKDVSLFAWKSYLVFTCYTLETRKLLNTLYQLQIFTEDYVRAAISCIRFYVNEATDYTDLCSRSKFLHQAQKHLETELQAQSFSPKRRKSTGSQHSGQSALTLELELSDIDRHINTISRQMEIAKFLRNSEQEGRVARKYLNDLSSMENENLNNQELPTLFGTQLQKTQLAVLAILCGRDVEEGFGIAFRIIQDYNLRSEKVYSLAGHVLASEQKISSVEQLVKCCRSSGAPDTNALSDRVLAHCVKLLINSVQVEPSSGSKDKVDSLIKLITDLELKISMCIESRQLKAAYLLAVRYSRTQDVKRIFKEADRLEQHAIKTICAKWLQKMQNS